MALGAEQANFQLPGSEPEIEGDWMLEVISHSQVTEAMCTSLARTSLVLPPSLHVYLTAFLP
eukprot:6179782-Pleurochrysis_carterae.AAC.2